MTRFATNFARTGAQSLTLQFGETIGYYNRAGDAVRNVSARVIRDPVQIATETGEINTQSIIVRLRNDAIFGVSSAEVDTGGDEINVPLRVGESAVRRTVARVLNDSNGILSLLVE